MKKFILGFITGGIICATATGFAVEYAVTANPFPVAVNGTETAIEGYNINDNTYFKLRDVADAVGGFNVGFSDNTITIDTDTAAEPTPTPLPSFTPAQIPIYIFSFAYFSLIFYIISFPYCFSDPYTVATAIFNSSLISLIVNPWFCKNTILL